MASFLIDELAGGKIAFCAIEGIVTSLFLLPSKPLFEDRREVQAIVMTKLARAGEVAWCAADETGRKAVFEMRSGDIGYVTALGSKPLVHVLGAGSVRSVSTSADGFSITARMGMLAWLPIKFVFDDVATASYANTVLSRALVG